MMSNTSLRATRWALHLGLFGGIAGLASGCGGATDARSDGASASPPPSDQPAGRDVLAIALGTEVRFISLDGGVRASLVGDAFFAGVTGVDLVAGGRFLVVRAYAESTPGTGVRLALLESDGAVQWTQSFAVSFAGGAVDSALTWGINLGEDGNVVLDDRNSGSFHMTAVGGSVGELPAYFPAGRSIDGFLPVRSEWTATNPYAVTYGWWKVGAGQTLGNVTHSTSGPGLDGVDAVFFGGRLLKLADHGGIVLLAQSSSGTAEIPLPQSTAAAHLEAMVDGEMFTADERWLVVGSGVADQVVRVDLQSGAAEAIALVAPDGYRPFASCTTLASIEAGIMIDREGRLVRAFRNDAQVAVFATTDGRHWSQMGGSFSGVGGLDVSVARDTLTIRGRRGVYCYVAGPTWSSTANADFVGDWTEIVRPTANTHLAWPNAAVQYVLSRSGRYGARWVTDGATHVASLLITDLETGIETNVATDATGIHSAQPAWLWEP